MNRVKPLKAPQRNLLDQSILSPLYQAHGCYACVRNPILATCSACSAKILLDSSSPREKQQRRHWLQKSLLRSEFAPLQTLSSLFRLVQFVKCWRIFQELNSKGLQRRSRIEKESRCLVFTSCQREIRHLHVIVMQKRQRNVPKKT